MAELWAHGKMHVLETTRCRENLEWRSDNELCFETQSQAWQHIVCNFITDTSLIVSAVEPRQGLKDKLNS